MIKCDTNILECAQLVDHKLVHTARPNNRQKRWVLDSFVRFHTIVYHVEEIHHQYKDYKLKTIKTQMIKIYIRLLFSYSIR